MQSILSYGLLAGLGTELILAFGLIVFIMKKPKIPCQKESLPLPVCQSDKCKQLETLMLNYMKTKLDFSDTSEELEAVKQAEFDAMVLEEDAEIEQVLNDADELINRKESEKDQERCMKKFEDVVMCSAHGLCDIHTIAQQSVTVVSCVSVQYNRHHICLC